MAGNPFANLSKGQKVAVGAGGAVVVFLVYRSYSKAKAASSATASTAATDPSIDPATGIPYADEAASQNIDPTTGYPYGSTQDTSALAAQSGIASGYNPAPTTVASSSTSTNAAWAQYVEQQLTSIGYDPQTVSAAIGRYLAQLPLTSDQATIVQVALAEAGPPPQGSYSVITGGTSTPTPPPPVSVSHPASQSGTVHSNTTNRSAPVTTTNGGYTWKYVGSAPKAGEPKNQTGTVKSTTTGLTAKVASYNGGLDWQYTG